MTCQRLTRDIARAAAFDAATAQMRAAGRTVWDEDDYNLCGQTFDRLWPVENDLA